jgi:hypothetical protein
VTGLATVAVLYGGPYDGFILADCPAHGAEVATQWDPEVNLLGRNGVPSSWGVDGDVMSVSGQLSSGGELWLRTAIYHRYGDHAWIEQLALPAYQ